MEKPRHCRGFSVTGAIPAPRFAVLLRMRPGYTAGKEACGKSESGLLAESVLCPKHVDDLEF